MKKWTFFATLLLASCAVAQQSPPALRGSFIASTGPNQFLRGHWSAQILPANKNAASGSWILFSKTNQVLLEGTWSAEKSARGWQGSWSAQIKNARTISGTWNTATTDFNGKTLADMLKRTAEKQIGGSWKRGRAHGDWWLQH
jgi:hypothetical protein